jgi:hypothetical protein
MPTFFRWVPKDYAQAAVDAMYPLVSHNGSATWIFQMRDRNDYRPRMFRGRLLVAYDMNDNAATNITTNRIVRVNFGDGTDTDPYNGENGHPWGVIIKANEIGALGLGRYRQKTTSLHTRARYANKREVASALEVNERSIPDAYIPPGGWGR